MAVAIGSYQAILSGAVGGNGSNTPLPSFTEVLTEGEWDGLDTDVFPPVALADSYEVLYPIPPQGAVNIISCRTDNGVWKRTQKAQSMWRHETIILQFRIKAEAISDWLTFLDTNKGKEFTLAICGVQPFIRSSTTNVVRLVDYTSPTREFSKGYKMSILFLYDPNYNSITI